MSQNPLASSGRDRQRHRGCDQSANREQLDLIFLFVHLYFRRRITNDIT
jgi:hypothetical protein